MSQLDRHEWWVRTVNCFEIGSRGYISTRNQSALYSLHKFVKPGVKLTKFKENIYKLSLYGSLTHFHQ